MTSSETIESVMDSIKEVKADLEFYHELFKKYNVVIYRDWETDRKSTRLNSSHSAKSRMPSSA